MIPAFCRRIITKRAIKRKPVFLYVALNMQMKGMRGYLSSILSWQTSSCNGSESAIFVFSD